MKFLRLELFCAIGLIACFFLPWLNIVGLVKVAGYEIPKIAKHVGDFTSLVSRNGKADPVVYRLYAVYLIPVFSALTILFGFSSKWVSKIFGLLAAVSAIGWFVYAYSELGKDLFDAMLVGAYSTLGCALLMILAVIGLVDISGGKNEDL